jgi:hypothetical protein
MRQPKIWHQRERICRLTLVQHDERRELEHRRLDLVRHSKLPHEGYLAANGGYIVRGRLELLEHIGKAFESGVIGYVAGSKHRLRVGSRSLIRVHEARSVGIDN